MKSSRATKRSRLSIFTIALANAMDGADGSLVNFLFTSMEKSLKTVAGATVTLLDLGILSSINRFSKMLFGPLWSIAADRWNRKIIYFIITGVWGIWTVLCGFAQTFEDFLILYTIGCLGTVAAEPIASSITADMYPDSQRGKAFGILRGVTGFGVMILMPVVALFAKTPEGWRGAMFLLGGLSIASGILILLFLHDPGRGASEKVLEGNVETERFKWRDVAKLLRIRTFVLLSISQIMVTSTVIISFLVPFLVKIRSFENDFSILVAAPYVPAFILSSFFSGLIGDYFNRRWPKYGRIVLMQIYLALWVVISYLTFQVDWDRNSYFVVFFVFGLIGSIGFTGAVFPMVSAIVVPELRTSAFGFLFAFLQGAVTGILSLVVGLLGTTVGLRQAFLWIETIPYAVNLFFWFFMYKRFAADAKAMQATLAERNAASPESNKQ